MPLGIPLPDVRSLAPVAPIAMPWRWLGGSPLIFVEELRRAAEVLNVKRQSEGMAPLDIECLLIVNDFELDAIETLCSLTILRMRARCFICLTMRRARQLRNNFTTTFR